MVSDAAQITFGADSEITLTHVADTGLTLNSTNKLMFNDASQFIQGASATVLDIAATDEIELTATLIDVVGNATVSGTLGVTGIATFTDDIIIGDGKTIGSVSDVDAITIASNGQLTLTQTLIGTALDISGDIDVDGTTNLDVVDIDGAVDMASTLQVDGAITSSAGATITTADNDPQLTLVSTDADANEGPILKFHRNSSSPADNDLIGQLLFHGEDGAGNDQQYANIQSIIMNNAQGNEDGRLTFRTLKAGTATSRLDISNAETVFNDSGVDVDFRVETDTKTHMFFVEGDTNRIGINQSDPNGQLHLQASDTGTDQLRISAAIGSYATNGIRIENSLGFSNTYTFIATQTDSDGDAEGTVTRHLLRGDGYTAITGDIASAPVLNVINDGNNANRYGLYLQIGADNAAGTNYAIRIFDGDGTEQGNVTFSGGTVSYNAFTAGHPAILPDDDNADGYAYGTLVETTSVGYSQKDGSDTERGIVYTVRKTQDVNSKRVLGVYSGDLKTPTEYYDKDSKEVLQGLKTVNDVRTPAVTNMHQIYCLGDGHILCNNAGGNISAGDGICSSNTAGIGQKAAANPSMIIGIAEEDITFASNSETKLVPVQFGKQQYVPWS
jgi:hypothetical protein